MPNTSARGDDIAYLQTLIESLSRELPLACPANQRPAARGGGANGMSWRPLQSEQVPRRERRGARR